MSDVQRLSEAHPASYLFIMPDKETNLYWIQQELDSFEVAEAADEEAAQTMIRSKSRCGDMPCAMHFDYDVGSDVITKIAQAPFYGLCWFVSGLSEDGIAALRKSIPNFDSDVLIITESVSR